MSCTCVVIAALLVLCAASPAGAQRELPANLEDATSLGAASMSPGLVMDQSLDRDRYRLGPGDQLLLVLEGKNIRRFPLMVLPEGFIDWEGGLQLVVAGLSLAEAERRVAEQLSPWMPDVAVKLLLLEPRLIEVYVIGEVNAPGAVQLRASDRISKALQLAGEPTSQGSRRFVELLAESGERERIDLYPFIMEGDWQANPYCAADRVLFVPVRSDTVQLVGEINRPGTYEWVEGETLGDFLDYAQGFTSDALLESVVLERDEKDVSIELVDVTNRDLPMRPSDVVVVGSRKPLMNRVFLEGAGERRGEVYLSDGETLGDLVRRLGDTRGRAMPE
jgi:protein involved in polysaccharide export with SLBB domain